MLLGMVSGMERSSFSPVTLPVEAGFGPGRRSPSMASSSSSASGPRLLRMVCPSKVTPFVPDREETPLSWLMELRSRPDRLLAMAVSSRSCPPSDTMAHGSSGGSSERTVSRFDTLSLPPSSATTGRLSAAVPEDASLSVSSVRVSMVASWTVLEAGSWKLEVGLKRI